MEELLQRTTAIQPVPDKPPTNAVYPASGYSVLPLTIRGPEAASDTNESEDRDMFEKTHEVFSRHIDRRPAAKRLRSR